MTRETKVGLLVGMAVILLIGIIVSDHLSMAQQQIPPDMTHYAPQAQNSLNADGTGLQTLPVSDTAVAPAPPVSPLPTPEQIQQPAPRQIAVRQGQDGQPTSPDTASDAPQTSQPPVATHLAQANHKPAVITLGPMRDVTDTPTFQQAALARSVTETHMVTSALGPQPSIHYVQSGETLYAIAQRYYNDGELWPVIRDANTGIVRSDNTVNLGARLVIPNKALLPKLLQTNPAAASVLTPVNVASARGSSAVLVQTGDTLSGLAAKYLGSSSRWRDLLQANSDQMDKATDLRVGMTLKIPAGNASTPVPAATTATRQNGTQSSAASSSSSSHGDYTVQAGDTLSHIARSLLGDASQWKRIFEANRDQLHTPGELKVGMKLKIPG
jgi:nucleoid-associated protein YgaU